MIVPTADLLSEIAALYERGCYLQAYTRALTAGPLGEWSGTTAQVLAGRLANQLGASRLAHRLHLRAWRADPSSLAASVVRARMIWHWRGPLEAWEFLATVADDPAQPAGDRADCAALRGELLTDLRDFAEAEKHQALAETIAPDDPWLAVTRSYLHERADDSGLALEHARRALAMQPWYRPGVQAAGRLLHQDGRDDEALELLTQAAGVIESGGMVAQLAAHLSELDRHREEGAWLDRYAELTPLRERSAEQWLTARRADVAYACGDFAEAMRLSRASGHPFHLAVAETQERAGPDARRVQLAVPFVRQDHMTCAPATLAALARFWGQAADQRALADAICYDGTPDHRERAWAEEAGFITREFAVTWDSAVALIDRGIPFTLTTVETTSAHLQAVIGYDARRGTFLIRDPGHRFVGEQIAAPLLARQTPFGPRGMALVPRERATLLADLTLPDADGFDLLNRLRGALARHDRSDAAAACAALEQTAAGSRLALVARRNLAFYDGDEAAVLAGSEALLALHPDCVPLRLMHINDLHNQSRRDQRLEALEPICAEPAVDPVFLRRLAQELGHDARLHPRAMALLRRVLRQRRQDAFACYLLANLRWEQRELDAATWLYRLAACIDTTDEDYARAYFRACRHLRRTDEAEAFLRARVGHAATRSGLPAQTLFWSLDVLERTEEGFTVLDHALERRGDDGDLLLYAARMHANYGRGERARELIAAAEGRAKHSDWLRASAVLSERAGDSAGALARWREALVHEPLALDAHRATARLLADREGAAAARVHLQATTARFPHHGALHELLIEWLREEGPAAQEPALRHLISVHPANAWAQRELAWALLRLRRLDEAEAVAATALGLGGGAAHGGNLRGDLRAARGDLAGAKQCWREAISASVDDDYAIDQLLGVCVSEGERVAEIRFVQSELERQVTFGDGLDAFRRHAAGVLDGDSVLATLHAAHQARPDLWQSWLALGEQLLALDLRDEALTLARAGCERFPLVPRLWLLLAQVGKARNDPAGEREALTTALAINPTWNTAARALSDSHVHSGDLAAARTVLERAVARDPGDCLNHGYLADVLGKLGEVPAQIASLERALRVSPGYDWAWNRLRERDRERAIDLARDVCGNRAGEARSWFMLARVLPESALDERLTALTKTIGLSPRFLDAHDLRAELLTEAGRHDEALAACQPDAWGAQPPTSLRRRAAWITAERGKRVEAIAQLRALLADEPHDFDAWRQIAVWEQEARNFPAAIAAAEELVRLQPRRAWAWGHLADARLAASDRAGAKRDFTRALELDQSYVFAANSLFDLQRENGELDQAATVLTCLQRHAAGGWTTLRTIELAIARQQASVAGEQFALLCAEAKAPAQALKDAVAAMIKGGMNHVVRRVLDGALDQTTLHEAVPDLWAAHWAASESPRACAERLDALAGRLTTRIAATTAFMEWMGENAPAGQISAYVAHARDFLTTHDACWAATGFAFAHQQANREAIDWLGDWRERRACRPWMLVNLALALRRLGEHTQATAISHAALTLPADGTLSRHRSWLAVEAALTGDVAGMRALLDQGDPAHSCYTAVRALAQAIATLHAPTGTAGATATAVIHAISTNRSAFRDPSNSELLRTLERCAALFAARSGPFGRLRWKLWGWTTVRWAQRA